MKITLITPGILDIIKYSIAVVIGGIITLCVNLYLQKRQMKVQYIMVTLQELYKPLYDEANLVLRSLEEFSDPFDRHASLKSWVNLPPTMMLRVPSKLSVLFNELHEKANKFHNSYLFAYYHLSLEIKKQLQTIINQLDESDSIELLERRVIEDYHYDFFAGKILDRPRSYPPSIMFTPQSSNLSGEELFKEFFEKVLTELKKQKTFINLRESWAKVLEVTSQINEYLEAKIKWIYKRYHRKFSSL